MRKSKPRTGGNKDTDAPDPAADGLVVLAPAELASLLRITEGEVASLTATVVSLPRALYERLSGPGSLELTLAEASLLSGATTVSLRNWYKRGLLSCRVVGGGSKGRIVVAPAELARRLREVQDGAGFGAGTVRAGQVYKGRANQAREEAYALCGIEPPERRGDGPQKRGGRK